MNIKEVEKSIIKKYRKQIWYPFVKAIKDYQLIEENDHIAVCISGGKDSFLLAKCMQELLRHGKIQYKLEFIVMDPGYETSNLNVIKENLQALEIEAHIFTSPIFEVIKDNSNPCFLCAKMRRGYLYDYAKKLGCNKIALGHHYDDVIETILLNLIYNGQYASMMPKLQSTNFEGMELIRPLYLIREKDIISFCNYNNLVFLDCACTVTKKEMGKRKEVKNLVNYLENVYKDSSKCLFRSAHNVNLNRVISYKKDEILHSFLDDYDN